MEIFPFNKEKYIEFRKFLGCWKFSIQKFLDKFKIDIKIL